MRLISKNKMLDIFRLSNHKLAPIISVDEVVRFRPSRVTFSLSLEGLYRHLLSVP